MTDVANSISEMVEGLYYSIPIIDEKHHFDIEKWRKEWHDDTKS
jgi:hypothetical protein